jgi:hypothetical protein
MVTLSIFENLFKEHFDEKTIYGLDDLHWLHIGGLQHRQGRWAGRAKGWFGH